MKDKLARLDEIERVRHQPVIEDHIDWLITKLRASLKREEIYKEALEVLQKRNQLTVKPEKCCCYIYCGEALKAAEVIK